MKKSKLKSPKRKVISHRYQKNSNASLSKLLHIASYKKKIRDLLINNRRLARELQSAKCEMAAQNSLLEDDAKNRNQVMLARRKINDMAVIINKLVAEMDEIRNCLDNVLSSNEMKFRSKRFLYPKKVVPTVDCIEEVSVLSSSDPSFSQNTPSPPKFPISSPSHPASGKIKYSDKMLLANSQSDDPESCEISVSLPPILFVEDNGGEFQETNVKKSSKNNSSKKDKGDNRSLTPELDIDLSCFRRKKSNSRRQSLFKHSIPRKTKSRGKSSNVTSPLLLSSREDCLFPIETSSNSCRTKVSNSRKTKSKGKASLEAESALLESQPIVCDSLSNDSCQTIYSVSDVKQSKFKNKSSPGAISPSLQCEEIFVQASHSTKHSLIQVSDSIKTRSKRKSSPEADLLLLQPEQMAFGATNNQRKTCVKITNLRETKSKVKSAASPMFECHKTDEKQQYEVFNNSHSSERHESLNYSSNVHCIVEKLQDCSNNLLTSDMPSNCATFKILPDSNIEPLAAIPNQTLLLSEDMELTDVIAANPILLEYDTVNKDCYYSKIKSNVPENSNYSRVNNQSEKEPSNMGELLESFVENNNNLPTIINDNLVMEQNKISEINKSNIMPLNQSLLISSAKRSRGKGGVQYCVYFSSSESSDSEDEYVPGTSKPREKRSNSSSEKRATVIFKPDANLKTSTISNNSSISEGNIAVHETSIFSFNVSHSEKDDINKKSINTPKKSKLSRNKKSNKKNDVSMKPLSQSCNVTKLKGFNYKFSKTKSPIGGNKLSKGKKEKSSNMYISVVTDGLMNKGDTSKLLTNVSQNKFSSFHEKDMTKSVQNAYKGVLKDVSISEDVSKKQDSSFEGMQYGHKRVSFAATDLVCKFKKMSLSKAIGANSKVRRISKSVAESGLFQEDMAVQLSPFEKLKDAEDPLFDFDGETELYSINSTLNAPNSASLETDLQSSPKSTISSNVAHKAILCTGNLTNKNNKAEKNSKKKVVASQKKLLRTASPMKNIPEFQDLPKKNVTEKSPSLNKVKNSKQLPCSNKLNDTKDSLFDFSDLTDLHTVNLTSDVLCPAPQADDQQPPSNINFPSAVEPINEMCDTGSGRLTNENEMILKTRVASSQKRLLKSPDILSPEKKNPGAKSLPIQTSKKSVKLYKDLKENYISSHLDTIKTGKGSKQRCPLSPIQPLQDDLKDRCIDTGENTLVSSAKCKKRGRKKFAKSDPVLKGNLNIKCSILGIDAPTASLDVKDTEAIDDRPKRRSKPVFYKEASLIKKMRRT